MSQFQLIPYNRIQDYFTDQLSVPVSEESIFNFTMEAFRLLADFEDEVKNNMLKVLNAAPASFSSSTNSGQSFNSFFSQS